ncbi:MAG: gamma-glutamyltransferase family protein [Anaerolineae bacterium]|nr:gamma-glutamyltransferase family protein [Phycisphaerae bacterium]
MSRIILLFACILSLVAPAPFTRADDVVRADHSLIISGHTEATKAGMAVLRRGGNAIDAFVTVSLSLGVTEPGNSGLGGKIALMYYDAKTKEVTFVAGLGQAAMNLPIEELIAKSADDRKRGYDAACVPALAATLEAAHKRWGTQPWKSLFDAPIKLAVDGFELTPLAAEMLAEFPTELDPEAARIYAPNGKHPPAGAVLKNPDLARTMQLLADGGADAFYHGETAQKIAAAMESHGGYLAADDFSAYKPRFLKPLSGTFHDYTIYSSAPPLSGGTTLIAALGALADMDWGRGRDAVQPRDARYIDSLCRVLQQIYPDVTRSAADAPDSLDRVAKILDPENLKELAKRAGSADPKKGALSINWPDRFDDLVMDDSAQASTTHLIIIDRTGNIVCATQSLGNHFGSGVVAPSTGVLLNNDMNNFAYATKQSINYVAGGKWPRSTMSPTIVLKNGKPYLVIGSPGGQRIPVGVLQVTLDVLQFNRPLQEAVNGPRFHLRRNASRNDPVNEVDLDQEFDHSFEEQLKKMGWATFRKDKGEFYFGAVNAAMFLPNGKILGVADQRRTGDAGGN